MVTVVFGDVKIRYLGVWPAGVSDAAVTSLCAQAETIITSKVGALGTVDLTSAAMVQLSVDVVVRLIERAQYGWAGGATTGVNPPPEWDREMQERLEQIMQDTTSDGIDTIDSHTWTES